jgi:branched-chain amino acid transport system permease protein
MDIVLQLAVVGIMAGTLYGLLGVTLTLMFRSTGILSFGHAGFALMGAYMYTGFSCPSTTGVECGPPRFSHPWIAALVCVATTTVVALIVERLVIRPLQYADVVRKSIATAAILGLASGLMLQIYGPQGRAVPLDQQLFPNGQLTISGVVIDYQRLGILVVATGLMAVIALLLSRSWFGLGVRAAGQRPDVVRLFGVRPATTSRFNWALGGALSGLAGVLVAPVSVVNVGTFSFLLVKAVAAALLGGLVSLPLTFGGGLLLGAVEAVTPHFITQAGSGTLGIAALVLASVSFNRRALLQLRAVAGVTGVQDAPPGRVQVAAARFIAGQGMLFRRLPRVIWAVAGIALISVPLRDAYWGAIGLNIAFYTLLALSLILPLGDAGQPTFVQIGFAGVAAFTASTLLVHDVPFGVAVLVAIIVAMVVGYAVGTVILRFRGAAFAILSLTFAAVISDFLLNLEFFEITTTAPSFFGVSLLESERAFAFALGLLVISFALVYNIRRTNLGASLRTMREGPRVLAQFGVDAFKLERAVFTLSAGIAGAAGISYALLVSTFTTFQFIPLIGVIVILAGFVGGLQGLSGPIIAGIIFGYGPTVVGNLSTKSANAFPQIASSLLALFLVVLAPKGLASLTEWASDVLGRAKNDVTARSTFRQMAVVPKIFEATPRWRSPRDGRARRVGAGPHPPRPVLRRAAPGADREMQASIENRHRRQSPLAVSRRRNNGDHHHEA